MPKSSMNKKQRAFTLLEILVVIGIIGLVATISAIGFSALNKSQALDADVRLVLSLLDRARNDTLSSKNASQYGVHFSSSDVTLFTGSSYSAGAASNKVSTLNSVTSLTPSISGGGSDIIFQRLTGETTQTGTVSLTAGGKTKTITVFGTGATTVQ